MVAIIAGTNVQYRIISVKDQDVDTVDYP